MGCSNSSSIPAAAPPRSSRKSRDEEDPRRDSVARRVITQYLLVEVEEPKKDNPEPPQHPPHPFALGAKHPSLSSSGTELVDGQPVAIRAQSVVNMLRLSPAFVSSVSPPSSPDRLGTVDELESPLIITGLDGTRHFLYLTAVLSKLRTPNHKYINQFKIQPGKASCIGIGSYCKVRRCLTPSGIPRALKIYNRDFLNKRRLDQGCPMDDVMREMRIWSQLHHNNIVSMFEVIDVEESDKLYLVLELVVDSDGKPHPLSHDGPVPMSQLRMYLRDIVQGLRYLHHLGCCHRDIKPDNLLLGWDAKLKRNVVKITDFGKAWMTEIAEAPKNDHGTLMFSAPELIRAPDTPDKDHDGLFFGCDLWSLGMTAFILAYGRPMFNASTIPHLCDSILHAEIVLPEMDGVHAGFRRMVLGLLQRKLELRTTLDELAEDPWLTESGPFPPLGEIVGPALGIEALRCQLKNSYLVFALAVAVRYLHRARKRLSGR